MRGRASLEFGERLNYCTGSPGPKNGNHFPTHSYNERVLSIAIRAEIKKQDDSITNKGNEGHRSEVKYGYLSYYEQTFA